MPRLKRKIDILVFHSTKSVMQHLIVYNCTVVCGCWCTISICVFFLRFYRATRMHSADYAVARCLSVCPSVTRRYCA